MESTRRLVSCAAAGLLCLSACSSDPAPGNPTPGDSTVLAGSFQVTLVAPVPATGTAGYTSLVGKVYDGATPSQIIWTVASTAGACKLSKPTVPFCSSCTGGAVCVATEKCQAYPTAKSVGTVRVTGIKNAAGAADFTMDPVAGTYQPGGASLPYPAFAEGDKLHLSTAGGAYAPFQLDAVGIAPLQVTSAAVQLSAGQPFTLTWTPPAQSTASTIAVKLDISHHGGTKGVVECTAPDTGSLQLPAALLTELLNLGVAGFPTVLITRNATPGSAVIAPGRVELAVSSSVEQEVIIPGVTSCNDDTQCPLGLHCQSDLTCK